MRKVVLMLLVAALAAPAMALVTITAVDEGSGLVSINYAATGFAASGSSSRIAGLGNFERRLKPPYRVSNCRA